MAVNLYAGGHHPQHLESLRAHWARIRPDGELHVVVGDGYRAQHPELLAAIESTPRARHHLAPAPEMGRTSRGELFRSDRQHGRVVSEWAAKLGADHVLLMYFDHVQMSLAFDLRFPRPLDISGIYFRPTFHYAGLGVEHTPKERLSGARKRLVLRLALRNPHLRYVFSLDHLAVASFPRTGRRVEAVPLPEPLEDDPATPVAGPSLADQVEPGRMRLLLFGSLDERKGVGPVLEALGRLAPEEQRRVALVLAGPVSGATRHVLLERIHAFAGTSGVQVVLEDRYLDEDEIQPLVGSSDLVLLTYVRHVGSSGVLVRAARAGVPVLSTDYGLLGVQVRSNRLGATVDTSSPQAIGRAVERWLADPATIPFDRAAASAFAAANTAEAFAETILSRLLGRPAPTLSPPLDPAAQAP